MKRKQKTVSECLEAFIRASQNADIFSVLIRESKSALKRQAKSNRDRVANAIASGKAGRPKKPKPIVSDAAQIVEMAESEADKAIAFATESLACVAAEYGCSISHVRRCRKKYGIAQRRGPITDPAIEERRKLIGTAEGTEVEVAERFGVSQSMVSKCRKKFGNYFPKS